jgi:hypothetical protein
MLRAASETYFWVHPNDGLQTEFKMILRAATSFVPRRNEIAHGAVDHYQPEPPEAPLIPAPDSYALFPSNATFKERNIEGDPTYCYTSAELEYFRQEFFRLRKPASRLFAELVRTEQRRASRGKFRSLYRSSTNQEPDKNDPQ